MNVVIINAVPLNGGDEALLRATLFLLKKNYPDANFTILCNDLIRTRRFLPDLLVYGDLDYVFGRTFVRWSVNHFKILLRSLFFSRFDFSKLFSIPSFLLTEEEQNTKNIFIHADLVISSSGGYLHDFYDNRKRLKVIDLVRRMNKFVVLFGQSIGPFWKPLNAPFLLRTLNSVNLILLRENISLKHLKTLGVNTPPIFVTTDNAFILHKKYPQLFRYRQKSTNNIALAFRSWQNDEENIIQLAKKICIFLLKSPAIKITFLSTCQGIPKYKDDSLIAQTIINQLPEPLQKRCCIDQTKYSVPDLIKEYSKYDAYIGMRLHGAILAMLGGTPAFNIGYEDKTEGIYSFLGLSKQHIFYSESEIKIKERILLFIENLSNLGNEFLASKIAHASEMVEKNIFYLNNHYGDS